MPYLKWIHSLSQELFVNPELLLIAFTVRYTCHWFVCPWCICNNECAVINLCEWSTGLLRKEINRNLPVFWILHFSKIVTSVTAKILIAYDLKSSSNLLLSFLWNFYYRQNNLGRTTIFRLFVSCVYWIKWAKMKKRYVYK